MKRVRLGVALTTVLLGALPADAQSRFPDPLVLIGPGASIGVRVRDLTGDDQQKAKLDSPAGVFVESVVAGTPAEKAGIKSGDVILEFDGERVRSVRGFTRLVSETPPQRTVKAVVLRDGARRTIDVTPESERRSSDGLLRIDPALPLLKPQPLIPQLPQGTPR
jgi:serine protease Do